MAYGFVQKDAGPAGAEHDFHFARGSFASVELQDGLAGGLFREIFRSLLAEEEIEFIVATMKDASVNVGAGAAIY